MQEPKKVNDQNNLTLIVKGREVSKPDDILSAWKDHFEQLATPTINETDEEILVKLQNKLIYEKELNQGSPIEQQPTNKLKMQSET